MQYLNVKLDGVNNIMKKTAIATALLVASTGAQAALVDGSVMDFTGAASGGLTQPASGSYFSMAVGDINFDGIPDIIYIPVNSVEGIILGATDQLASGSHNGIPDGTESPSVDSPWNFFNNTGMHEFQSGASVIASAGNTATLDFSGWTVDWNGVEINMGSTAWGSNPDGVANVTCGVDCGDGDTYTLDYTATVPNDGSTNFGGVQYGLHLEGTISAVPVPAAVWLFGSGLLGLVGVARRRKAA